MAFQNLLWYDAVQIACLMVLISAVIWLAKRSMSHGEDIAQLKLLVTNHYKTRFNQIARVLGIQYEDED